MAEIVVSGIEKSFEQDRVVLDGVSFQVDAGERVGLLGPNGAGKTTLLRIMTGELTADKGTITIPQGRRIGYISQLAEAPEGALVEDVLRMAFDEVMRVKAELEAVQARMDAGEHDNALLRRFDALSTRFDLLGGYDCETRLAKVASGLHIPPAQRTQPFASLSGGEQTRIRLAVMILRETDILLLDEPTNHLDMASIEWLENYLDHYKGTVLAVSHDRYFLDRTVTRIVELDHGGVEFYTGNYSDYVVEKEARYKLQLKQYEKEQAKIAQLQRTADRMHTWAQAYDNPALHKRAQAMEKRIEWLRKTEKPTREERLALGFSTVPFRADYALRVRGLEKGYGGRTLFRDVTETIRGGGERVALVGANGAGKTTLLKILLGEETADAGVVQFGPSVRAAYLPQQIVFEHPERTLYDTLLYELKCEPQQARDRLGAYRFRGEDQFKRVNQLSGGERARLKLCLLMNASVNMLILDEPTNHLDLDSREWIESAVDQFEGTLLIVSHDRYFVRRFATRVWELNEGELRDYDCGYEKYRFIREREEEARALRLEQERAARRAQEKREKAERPARPGRRDAKAERRMGVIEREMARLEGELEALDARAEENASDYVRLGEIEEERAGLQAKIDALYEEWAALDAGA
ncbi:MAG: ATP-binding cassette domain-containing protein [Clostridia bacterium]|nr:ATP-binding cassette domain-containing protein [Clostridia bacterium]